MIRLMYDAALKILKIINDNGFEAYMVGGYPRDLILNRKCTDVDICTSATPKELKSIFKDSMLPKVQYGSVTVLYNKIRFEITTYRKDIKYENNRVPVKVKYINNLLDDLKRRDFTINTICMDANGNIIDLLNGRQDLESKTIKMFGNPKYRLKEDALRILRAVRFATVLDFKLEDKLRKYIVKYGYLLKRLSYYRKKEELEKIFLSTNAIKGLHLLKELHLDKFLELSNIDNVKITSSIIGVWAQLDVENIYEFNNNEKTFIRKINELQKKELLDNFNLYAYGLYISSIVGEIKGIDRTVINERYNSLPIKSKKDIQITASRICETLNRKQGAFLGDVFKDLEYQILNNGLENKEDVLCEYVKNKF